MSIAVHNHLRPTIPELSRRLEEATVEHKRANELVRSTGSFAAEQQLSVARGQMEIAAEALRKGRAEEARRRDVFEKAQRAEAHAYLSLSNARLNAELMQTNADFAAVAEFEVAHDVACRELIAASDSYIWFITDPIENEHSDAAASAAKEVSV